MKGVIMRNLRGTIFDTKTNVLPDFHIYISVPLMGRKKKFPVKKCTMLSSSHQRCSIKRDVLKKLCKIHRKTPAPGAKK